MESTEDRMIKRVAAAARIEVRHQLSTAELLHQKLNNELRVNKEIYLQKFGKDIKSAFGKIFEDGSWIEACDEAGNYMGYEKRLEKTTWYQTIFNESETEIIGINFVLEHVQTLCENSEVGAFWKILSLSEIEALIIEEFKFAKVSIEWIEAEQWHEVICMFK